jgi:2',3'-cyclic-nucleotide 2'-phosphodiesterase (5'-nucleotidase family)
MDYIKVKGHDHLIRDPKTNSIINTNMSEYNEYISRRDLKMEENQKVQNLESDVANMKDDLNEIKNLLRSLINESR